MLYNMRQERSFSIERFQSYAPQKISAKNFFKRVSRQYKRIDLSYKQTIKLYPQTFSAYYKTIDIRNILEQHIEGFLDLLSFVEGSLRSLNSLGFGSMSEDTDIAILLAPQSQP